jgi:teichoic acid transport system ATP-binding protein
MSDLALSAPATAPAPARAIEVDGVSVSYRVRIDSPSMLTDLRRLVSGRSRQDRTVPALQDVSFTVPRGTVLGVIGRNGAGKSTLLRVIAGILAPDRGRVVVRGRISTLLSVGVGFDLNLTGRENIKLGGLAVGLSERRLAELTDSIAEFAQLDEYLDYPLRTYSAGMKSRLGFALAAHLDPEVLLIDEALSGGDTAFGKRVQEKMAELCGQGRTIVLVTHGLMTVRSMASEALWLHQGKVAAHGDPDDVCARYMRFCRIEQHDWSGLFADEL